MYILIGDIGNTNIKLCLIESKNFKIKKLIYFRSKKIISKIILKKILKKIISKNLLNKKALFSSVVPEYYLIIKKFLKKNYKIEATEIKEKNINKIISINVKNKQQVGSDRIANAVAVYKEFKENCIVLDFGTATTFDVVTKNGKYNGGVIAPGINLSLNSLVNSADQIPSFLIKKQSRVVGKSTVEALRSGFFWGYTGLINNIISKIEKETKIKYKVIFTGGYSDLFKTSINRSFKIDKNITIKGIIEIYKKNKNFLN